MTIRSLAEVGAHLEEAYGLLPGEAAGPADAFVRYEMLCIAELDAYHDQFAPGLLQEYLETKLYIFQLEHGLLPLTDPREE